jgi:hypothetical protein
MVHPSNWKLEGPQTHLQKGREAISSEIRESIIQSLRCGSFFCSPISLSWVNYVEDMQRTHVFATPILKTKKLESPRASRHRRAS